MLLDDEDIEAIAVVVVRKIRMQTDVTPEFIAGNFTLEERKAYWKERMNQQKETSGRKP